MATIDKDGVYRVGDKETGTQIQYLKGAEVADDLDITYVGPFPDPIKDAVAEANEKANPAPANKAAAAPENKKA